LLKILIPTGAGVAGAVLSNRSQAGAISDSKEELEKARAASANWLLQALQGAQPYADWNLGEQRAGSDWAFSGGQDALDTGYGRASALMQPYADAGVNALGRLSSLGSSTPRVTSYKGQTPSVSPPYARSAQGGESSAPAFSPVARTPYPRTAPAKFSVPGGVGGVGGNALAANAAGGPAGFDLRDNQVGQPNFAVRNAPAFGALAGMGAGALIGAGAGGAAAGAGLGTALLPGIGTAAGLLVGGLVGRLTRAGREREGATEAVKEYSNWVWNEVMPQARSGKLSKADAQAAIEAGWTQYTNWLDQNIKDTDVNRNSKTSQRGWLDEGLNGPNGWASVPA